MADHPKAHEVTCGGCGLLMDETPLLTAASIKPYVVAILLHRGAVRRGEVLASLVPHCADEDIKIGAWDSIDEDYCDSTRAEKLVDEVLGEFVLEGILRYNEQQDLWVLTGGQISTIISWVTSLGARLPQHLSLELSRKQLNRIPPYVEFDHAI